MTSRLQTSHAARKIVHTYGKRGSRQRNDRSASIVSESVTSITTQEDTQETRPSLSESEDEELPDLTFPNLKTSTSGRSSSTVKPGSRPASLAASTSRVPEVIIYTPRQTSHRTSITTSKSKHSDVVSIPTCPTSRRSPDAKGKGRTSTHQQEETSSSDSDTVYVATTAADASVIRHVDNSTGDALHDSALSASPLPMARKAQKRRQNSFPEHSPERSSKREVKASSTEAKIVRHAVKKEEHPTPETTQQAPQVIEDTIDTLFDDLLSEAAESRAVPSTSSNNGGRLAQMSARPAEAEFVRPSLCEYERFTKIGPCAQRRCLSARSSSMAASPVRLQRAPSWSQRGSPDSRSGSPFQRDGTAGETGNSQRAQAASEALQAMLSDNSDKNLRHRDSPSPSKILPTAADAGRSSSKGHSAFPVGRTSDRPNLSRASSQAGSSPQHSQEDLGRPRLPARRTLSYNSLKQELDHALNHELSDEEEEDSLEESGILHSVNQLRSAGENRRFTDEMHYLLEGFDATQSLGIQRTR